MALASRHNQNTETETERDGHVKFRPSRLIEPDSDMQKLANGESVLPWIAFPGPG